MSEPGLLQSLRPDQDHLQVTVRRASAEGKSGGQFYTPSRVVRVLVDGVMVEYRCTDGPIAGAQT